MSILKASTITIDDFTNFQNGVPTIICNYTRRVKRLILESNTIEINVGLFLSKFLLDFAPEDRPKHISDGLLFLISNENSVLLTNIDILFNPDYKINPMKLFCDLSRKSHISLLWPGTINNGFLVYAEEKFRDFIKFDISTYTINCIV